VIVVDTSALYAIQFDEPEADTFARLLRADRRPVIGAPTLFEYHLVVADKYGPGALFEARGLIERLDAATVDFTEEMTDIATEAFLRYERGRDTAALHFGDCMAYAVARSLNAPLLYKGGDFALTDIRRAA